MLSRKAVDIMTRKVVTLSPETDIYTAMKTFLAKRFSGAPVVDARGTLIGILSEKDCLKVLTGEAFDGLPEGRVADYMTKPVETVSPETNILDIVGRFLNMPFRRLPVVDDEGRLIGQISRRDLLRAIDSMRDNSYLYGTKEPRPIEIDENMGVHSAMRIARSR